MKKKIFIGLLLLLVAIQFIQPNKNTATEVSKNNITNKYQVPQEVATILKTSCYDCHSNNTVYPWYSNIQPGAWFIANHVNEGKSELNFDEFLSYPSRKAAHKLEEVAEVVERHEMPLSSYTLIHTNAKLNDEQIKVLKDWALALKSEIEK
jgi:hypothetical protein